MQVKSIYHSLVRGFVFAAFAAVLTGCQFFLPAHENSYDTEGERVMIRPLVLADMTNYADDYESVFGVKPSLGVEIEDLTIEKGEPKEQAALAVASIAAGFLINETKRRLEREAESYAQQFCASRSGEGFYDLSFRESEGSMDGEPFLDDHGDPFVLRTRSRLAQRIFGFEVVRTTTSSRNTKGEYPYAYKLVLGIHYSAGNGLLRVAPLLFHTRKAKAKVLNTDWKPAWLWSFLLNDGDLLDSTAEITITSTFVNVSEQVEVAPLGPAIVLEFKNYNLENTPILRARSDVDACDDHRKDAEAKLSDPDFGWIGAVPVTRNGNMIATGNGAYQIKVVVTEKDPSNVKEYLTRAVEFVGEEGEKLMKEYVK